MVDRERDLREINQLKFLDIDKIRGFMLLRTMVKVVFYIYCILELSVGAIFNFLLC